MKERWLAGINDLKRDIKEAPGPWIAAAAVLLFVIFRWGKKILGLDSLGITTDYPAVSGMAVMMLVLSGIALAVILWYVLRTKEFRLDKMYLRCGLLLGALYLFILPPLSAPDEWVHYVTAYKVSNQILGLEVLDENGEVLVQEEEMQANDGAFPDAEQYHYFWEHYLGKETGDEMVSSGKGPNGYSLSSTGSRNHCCAGAKSKFCHQDIVWANLQFGVGGGCHRAGNQMDAFWKEDFVWYWDASHGAP